MEGMKDVIKDINLIKETLKHVKETLHRMNNDSAAEAHAAADAAANAAADAAANAAADAAANAAAQAHAAADADAAQTQTDDDETDAAQAAEAHVQTDAAQAQTARAKVIAAKIAAKKALIQDTHIYQGVNKKGVGRTYSQLMNLIQNSTKDKKEDILSELRNATTHDEVQAVITKYNIFINKKQIAGTKRKSKSKSRKSRKSRT